MACETIALLADLTHCHTVIVDFYNKPVLSSLFFLFRILSLVLSNGYVCSYPYNLTYLRVLRVSRLRRKKVPFIHPIPSDQFILCSLSIGEFTLFIIARYM